MASRSSIIERSSDKPVQPITAVGEQELVLPLVAIWAYSLAKSKAHHVKLPSALQADKAAAQPFLKDPQEGKSHTMICL